MKQYLQNAQQSALTHIDIPVTENLWQLLLILGSWTAIATNTHTVSIIMLVLWIQITGSWDKFLVPHVPHKQIV
eukprot:8860596-Ditylum_brightwellii.AAC.1